MSNFLADPAKQTPVRFLVVDLEATCWEHDPPAPHEIIEIGSVCYEVGTGTLDEFQTFVQPMLQPVLSAFCRQLTRIRQADVNAAPRFPEALATFCSWAADFAPYTFASWGAYDRNQLRDDCARHRVRYPFTDHINLKQVFADVHNCRPCGMAPALRMCGLRLEGTHHRGIDDARNIARILEHMILTAGLERVLGA